MYPCTSFVKRYVPGERSKMDPHTDINSMLTANVLLSDPSDFKGGLHMFPGVVDTHGLETSADFADLPRGVLVETADARVGELIIHRGYHWHGVKLYAPLTSRRYS